MIEFVRSRRIEAPPERIWPLVDDVTRWPEWFTEAERCEVLSGQGVGRKQRMYGHARGKATEIAPDGAGSLVTYRLRAEPGSLRNTFMLRFLAPGPIGKSFETSLARLAALVETTG